MRRSHGLYSRQPAAGSFKCPTSTASSTTTNEAPPDHCSRRRQTGTTGLLTGHRPLVHQFVRGDANSRLRTLTPRVGEPLIAGRRRLIKGADRVSGRDTDVFCNDVRTAPA